MTTFQELFLYMLIRQLMKILCAVLKRLPGDEDVFHCLGLLNMAIENQLERPDFGRF